MDIEVKGCMDCLLRDVLESGSNWCFHPKKNDYLYEDDDFNIILPYNCPLLRESLTITIKPE